MRNTEALEKMSFAKPIVFFDGVCVLCNHSVQFLLRHNPKKDLHFAALQEAATLLHLKELESIVVLKNGQYYTSFIAIRKLLPHLSVPFRIMGSILYLIPHLYFYKKIAQNRYRWFGKKDQCMLPNKEEKNRFLNF